MASMKHATVLLSQHNELQSASKISCCLLSRTADAPNEDLGHWVWQRRTCHYSPECWSASNSRLWLLVRCGEGGSSAVCEHWSPRSLSGCCFHKGRFAIFWSMQATPFCLCVRYAFQPISICFSRFTYTSSQFHALPHWKDNLSLLISKARLVGSHRLRQTFSDMEQQHRILSERAGLECYPSEIEAPGNFHMGVGNIWSTGLGRKSWELYFI